jgi:hypothetical protein
MTGVIAIVRFRVLAEFGVGWVGLGRSFLCFIMGIYTQMTLGGYPLVGSSSISYLNRLIEII